eukprot:425434_1
MDALFTTLMLISSVFASIVPQLQIDSLVDIYNSLNGQSWSCTWNITKIKKGDLTDTCYMIHTDIINYPINSNITSEVVTGIYFYNVNNVSGELPISINNLTTLKQIRLSSKGIYGTLHDSIGNLLSLETLYFFNTSLTGTIPSSICGLTQLTGIEFIDNKFTGTIPECIFINNEYLNSFSLSMSSLQIPNGLIYPSALVFLYINIKEEMMGTIPSFIGNISVQSFGLSGYFNGSIPESICNSNTLESLDLINLPTLIGNLPDCLFDIESLQYFKMNSTSISGDIPLSFCNASSRLYQIHIENNNNLRSIPSCDSEQFELSVLNIASNVKLIGTISDSLWCSSKLSYICVTNNTNMNKMKVPNCWKHIYMPYLSAINIENNNFVGTFPKLNTTMYNLRALLLGDNELEGTISDFLSDFVKPDVYTISDSLYTQTIQHITLHNNRFTEPDVSTLLFKLIGNYTNTELKTLSLYGNTRIKGTLPNFKDQHINQGLQYILLHGCDIYGTIPANLEFKSLKYLTLFNNRLSYSVPEKFAPMNATSLVISSNLFQSNNNNQFAKWVDRYFCSAVNLFVTTTETKTSLFLLITGFACFIFHIVSKIKTCKNCTDNFQKQQFIKDIQIIQSKFEDWKLILLVVLLVILYPLSSKYYEYTPMVTWFTLSWFYDENINSWHHWVLFVVIILINIMFCHIVSTLYVIQLQAKHTKKSVNEHEMHLLYEKIDGDENSSVLVEYNVKTQKNKCVQFMTFTIYFLLYVFGILMIILYAFCDSLPDDNTLVKSSLIRNMITQGMSVILIIDNVFIVPNLCYAASCFLSQRFIEQNKFDIIFLLRTSNTLIIPIIVSILLLNDCGRWWTQYWTPCDDENMNNNFNLMLPVFINVPIAFSGVTVNLQLLSPEDVCSTADIAEINWSKCIRSFFYNWTSVIIIKFIIMIFMPYINIIKKIIQAKIRKLYYEYKGRICKEEPRIKIDSEFAMIISSFESVITFSIISPLIIPITLVAIDSYMFSYNYMLNKLDWKLTSYKDIYSSFPVYLLIVGILCQQLLTSSFILFAVGNILMFCLNCIFLVIIDSFYLIVCCKTKHNL